MAPIAISAPCGRQTFCRAALNWNYSPLNDMLLLLIDKLSLPLEEKAARRALRDFAEDTSFDFYAYLYLSGSESFAVSNYSREWQKLYMEKDFIRVDPVVTKAKHGPPLFAWSADEARRSGRHGVSQFFTEADRFGIRSGISISIPVGFKNRMVFTLASGRPVSGNRWSQATALSGAGA